MTVYTYAQLEQLWIQAGGPKTLAPVAAAIAEAESGGNSDAYNGHDSNGRGGTQVSAGLWQISNGTMTPVPNWSNPAVNAQDAVAKWKGAGGFSPWGTYTSGAYRGFLSGSTTPDPNVPGSPTQLMAATMAAGASDCLLGNPFSASVGVFGFNLGGSIGPSCLFTKSNARGFIGVGFMLVGGALFANGTIFLLAGAGIKAAQTLGFLPMPQPRWKPPASSPAPSSGSSPASSGSSPTPTGYPTWVPQAPAASGAAPKVIPGQVLSSSTAAAPLAIAAA